MKVTGACARARSRSRAPPLAVLPDAADFRVEGVGEITKLIRVGFAAQLAQGLLLGLKLGLQLPVMRDQAVALRLKLVVHGLTQPGFGKQPVGIDHQDIALNDTDVLRCR
ncbi:hypothetical protein [Roseovarius pacificus]|uniref:hypothetical protein n=1 Tax=Roseovarius pacificus TaxID=337701 RepID=UPI002A18DE94|nr:hypothetical protein [Roseovarius pacificus]